LSQVLSYTPARQPRASVVIDADGRKAKLPLVAVDVTSNGYFSADTFRVVLALTALPDGYNAGWWSKADRALIEVFVALSDGEPGTSMIAGRVDDVELDLGKAMVTLVGRDFTADMIESRTTEKFPNRTASEIVTQIATARGLTPVVTATTAAVGTYYDADHVRLNDDTTEWSLLTYLAEQEGFDIFVRGMTLYFQPPAGEGTAAALIWDATGTTPKTNLLTLTMRRSLVIARGATVRVISWNARRSRAIRVTRRATNARRTDDRGGQGQVYVFRVPNLTEEEAIRYAEAQLQRITRHERLIEVTMPGELTLAPPERVTLSGTGTSWDQDYFIQEIERRLSFEEGFVQRIRAKNHSPQSQAAL
jgi:phage protein D